MPVGGHIIRKKALEFATDFEILYFKSSERCNRYSITVRRYDVIFLTISVEERSCTADMTIRWKQTHLSTILSRCELKDIFNAHGLRLFFQQLPTKSLNLKGECCNGRKHSKVRLIGIAAGNGVDKQHAMFIFDKSETPRCFKGVKSVTYQY